MAGIRTRRLMHRLILSIAALLVLVVILEGVLRLAGWNNFRNFYGFRQPGETDGPGLGVADFILDLRVYKLVLMASERLRGVGPKPLDDAMIEAQSTKDHLEEARRLTSDSSGNLERGMALKEAGEIDLDLADMQRLCESNKALLVIQNYPLGDFPMLERFAKREKLPFANHLGGFNAIPESDRDLYFLPGDFHPNALGNGVMAETLYQTLTETGLFRKANPDDA